MKMLLPARSTWAYASLRSSGATANPESHTARHRGGTADLAYQMPCRPIAQLPHKEPPSSGRTGVSVPPSTGTRKVLRFRSWGSAISICGRGARERGAGARLRIIDAAGPSCTAACFLPGIALSQHARVIGASLRHAAHALARQISSPDIPVTYVDSHIPVKGRCLLERRRILSHER
jgi:hypothetical protein